MTTEFVQWTSPCSAGHDAAWISTPQDGPRYSCADCDTDQPAVLVLVPPSAWTWKSQRARRSA